MLLVSIITPTYNHMAFIGPCIQSVLAQSYPHWEMIIVNDGSNDATEDILDEYAARDSRIRVFHQKNKGIELLSETYNFALEKSNGSLIAILEGDDCWPAHKLATQVPLHDDPEVFFSYGRAEAVNGDGKVIRPMIPETAVGSYTGSEFLVEWMLKRSFVIPVTLLMCKEALQAIGGFVQGDIYPAVDCPTISKLFASQGQAGKVVLHDAVLGYWRSHETNTSKLRSERIHLGYYQTAQQRLVELHPRITADQFQNLRRSIGVVHKQFIGIRYLIIIRRSLIEGDYSVARQESRKLFFGFGFKRSAQAVLGYICGVARTDMESFFKVASLFGSGPYKKIT